MIATRAFYNEEIQAAIWEINGFVSFDEFKAAGSETHKLRKDHNSKKQLNNIKDMKILSNDIKRWIDTKFFPMAEETGLKFFAFVVPINTFGKISMENVNKDASEKYNMEIEYFEDEYQAVNWLNSKS